MNRLTALALALFAAIGTALSLAGPAAAANPTATTFELPTNKAGSIAPGAGGKLWWTDNKGVGTVTTSGEAERVVDTFRRPYGILEGPDGNMWVSESLNGRGAARIGRITPAGVLTEFGKEELDGAGPGAMVEGPDGALWFGIGGEPAIGRITSDGAITKFPVAGSNGTGNVTVGADGRLWFTTAKKKFGAMTTDGEVELFDYDLPGKYSHLGSFALGPDGRIWAEAYISAPANATQVFRIDTDGTLSKFADVPFGARLGSFVNTPDGNVWAINNDDGFLARFTPDGEFALLTGGIEDPDFPQTQYGSWPTDLTLGPDGNLWFVSGPKAYRLSPEVEDTTAPQTKLKSAPPEKVLAPKKTRMLEFAVKTKPGTAALRCSLLRSDSAWLTPCEKRTKFEVKVPNSPGDNDRYHRYEYTFYAAAEANGVLDPTPVKYTVAVKRKPSKRDR